MAFAFVSTNDTYASPSGTTIALVGQVLATGECVIVELICGDITTTFSSVSDGTNTYTKLGTPLRSSTTTRSSQLFVALNVVGGTYTITGTYSGATPFRDVAIWRYTGIASIAAVQGQSGLDMGSSGVPDDVRSGLITPTAQPALLWGSTVSETTPAPTTGTGFTSRGVMAALNTAPSASLAEDRRLTGLAAVQSYFGTPGTFQTYNTWGLVLTEAPPPVLAGPVSQAVAAGTTATFTVSVLRSTGTGLAYQWQDNRSGAFANIAGATSNSYTTAATTQAFQGRSYRCVVTDSNGSTTSGTASLGVLGFKVLLWTTAPQTGANVILRDPLTAGAGGGTTYTAPTPTGGFQTGGVGLTAKVKAFLSTGGFQTGGVALTARVKAAIATGGFQTGGVAATAKVKAYLPTGGFQTGGVAATARVGAWLATGGFQTGGAAATARVKAYIATGGAIWGGVALSARVRCYPTSGGFQTGGGAITSFVAGGSPVTYTYSGSGGMVFGGAAVTSFESGAPIVVPLGGGGGYEVELRRPPGRGRVRSYRGHGGFKMAGHGPSSFVKGAPPVKKKGRAPVIWWEYVATGGMTFGGSAVCSFAAGSPPRRPILTLPKKKPVVVTPLPQPALVPPPVVVNEYTATGGAVWGGQAVAEFVRAMVAEHRAVVRSYRGVVNFHSGGSAVTEFEPSISTLADDELALLLSLILDE